MSGRASHRAAALPGIVLLAAAVAVAAAPRPRQGRVFPESHRRMAAVLAEITAAVPPGRLVASQVPQLEAAVAALPADAPLEQRVRALGILGEAYLDAGESARAIEVLTDVEALLLGLESPPAGLLVTTRLVLGVAHLRRAQDANCLDHTTARRCILPLSPSDAFAARASAEAAAEALARIVEAVPADQPNHLTARWLLNLVAMFLGEYPDRLTVPQRIDPLVWTPELTRSFPTFVDVAGAVGVATLSQAGGVVVDDFDGDGRLDVLVSSMVPGEPFRLLRNGGDTFVDASATHGPVGITGGFNMAPADFDNDGDVDIYVTRGGWLGDRGRWPDSLLRNDEGRLVDVTFDVGLGDERAPSHTAAWADYDLDGDLDLYVGNETEGPNVFASRLYENRGGAFVDVADVAGVANYAFAKGVAWGDYDGDGDPDLYVSNFGSANRLYENRGRGRFVDVARRLGLTDPTYSFVPWFWDVNNDGHLDLLVNAYRAPDRPGGGPAVWTVAAARLGRTDTGPVPALYIADGNGGFHDDAEAWGIAVPTLPMGANFGDLDNDGYPDFYLGTGYPGLEGLVPNVMYRNRAGAGFEEVTFAGRFGHLGKGHGIAFADLDDDGDQDVFAQMGGMQPNDASPDALFENPGFGNHWIRVRLVDPGRAVRGARVEARIRDVTGARSVFATVGQGGSFGAGPRRLEIGVGGATIVDELRVRWPGDPAEQVFAEVAVDRAYTLVRGEGALRETTLPARQFPADR